MAANDYYGEHQPYAAHSQPHPTYRDDDYNHQSPVDNSEQLHTTQHPPLHAPYNTSNEQYGHQPQYSQHSFSDENPYVGGRNHPSDHYGEDIPLKQNVQQPETSDTRWMEQNTNYHAGMPIDPIMGARKKRRRTRQSRFFGKRTPWVTWLLTAVDIGVFVGELIYSGTLCFHLHQFRESKGYATG